jgi:hypothetical protein
VNKTYERHCQPLAVNAAALRNFTGLFYYEVQSALRSLQHEFKSPEYAAEREWRLVARRFRPLRPMFRVGAGHIVPYFEMPLPQNDNPPPAYRLAISHIILGPRCQPTVVRSIRQLLQNIAYPEVIWSRVPLR